MLQLCRPNLVEIMHSPYNSRRTEIEHFEWLGKIRPKLVERMDLPKFLRIKMRVSVLDYSIDGIVRLFFVPFCFDKPFVSCFVVHGQLSISAHRLAQ
jgi:hypothetical protein